MVSFRGQVKPELRPEAPSPVFFKNHSLRIGSLVRIGENFGGPEPARTRRDGQLTLPQPRTI